MKPILILPRGQMSQPAIKMLRDNGLCVVEAKDPSKIRFVETPLMDYSQQEQAAIKLVRKLLADETFTTHEKICQFLTEEFVKGSSLKPVSSPPKA